MNENSLNPVAMAVLATVGLVATFGLKVLIARMLPAPVTEDYPEALINRRMRGSKGQ